jgi:hypothetical protein
MRDIAGQRRFTGLNRAAPNDNLLRYDGEMNVPDGWARF